MNLKLDEFLYELPQDRIAKHPPRKRGESRLLKYHKGTISHHQFREITDLIPKGSSLFFNDTRVIPARVIMYKETGAKIEVFLLEPLMPSHVHEEVMAETSSCTWKCMIGNAKKWKIGSSLEINDLKITANRVSENEVTFRWDTGLSFSDLLVEIGKIPLPPYIDREVSEEDSERYQTVYSKASGAVAAPTAGLHFTDQIIEELTEKGVSIDYLTLHVSAGTFQPIKSASIHEHPMHNEQVWITQENVENLLKASSVIAVGTTSMRTLESLYWFGVKLSSGSERFFIDQKDPYNLQPISAQDSLEAIVKYMNTVGIDKLGGHTEIFLYPGYKFKLCDGLVTNYHLPGSTLILLIAAFVGDDWKKIYEEALAHDCLLYTSPSPRD